MLLGPITRYCCPQNRLEPENIQLLKKHIRTSHESVEQLKSKYVYGKLN